MSEESKELTVYQRLETTNFTTALPKHITNDKFVKTALTALVLNPELKRIAEASRGGTNSLILACSKAAADGLILDGREAALVPMTIKVSKRGETDKFEKRLQYIPMVQGLLKRARNSGEIADIDPQVVFERDKFIYRKGDDACIIHEPFMDGDPGRGKYVYAIATMKDGTKKREVMTERQVMRIASQSKNPDQYDQTKGKNWEEWWRKTIIRRITKYIANSSDNPDLVRLVDRIDETFDYDRPEQDLTPPAGKRRGGAAEALRDITPGGKTTAAPKQEEDYSQDPDDYIDSTVVDPNAQPDTNEDRSERPGDPF